MTNDQFTKLFNHMNVQFDEIRRRLDGMASQSSVDNLTQTVDSFAQRLDYYEIENSATRRQLDAGVC